MFICTFNLKVPKGGFCSAIEETFWALQRTFQNHFFLSEEHLKETTLNTLELWK